MSEARTTTRRRISRANRTRARIKATTQRPVLSVFRSNQYIYAQIVDTSGKVLAASSDMKADKKQTRIESAKQVGLDLAKQAIANKVKDISFDRHGYKYHGRVKALADAVREGGLNF